MYANADRVNRSNILGLVRAAGEALPGQRPRLLDMGCNDGAWAVTLGNLLHEPELSGVEIVPEQAEKARGRGLEIRVADLAFPTDFTAETFDIVHANQVIEHLPQIDVFVAEIYRLLRPGGIAVISTENGSSWHNIAAAILGWQIFSLTNVSGKIAGLGNPLAIHRAGEPFSATWTHKTIFNYLGLKELFEIHGFNEVRIAGAGYYPLPAFVGKWDPRHAAFITVRARKGAPRETAKVRSPAEYSIPQQHPIGSP